MLLLFARPSECGAPARHAWPCHDVESRSLVRVSASERAPPKSHIIVLSNCAWCMLACCMLCVVHTSRARCSCSCDVSMRPRPLMLLAARNPVTHTHIHKPGPGRPCRRRHRRLVFSCPGALHQDRRVRPKQLHARSVQLSMRLLLVRLVIYISFLHIVVAIQRAIDDPGRRRSLASTSTKSRRRPSSMPRRCSPRSKRSWWPRRRSR